MGFFKGFRHLISQQKNQKELMNQAPWGSAFDRTGKTRELLSKEPTDYTEKEEQPHLK